jgi:hypothetical protein
LLLDGVPGIFVMIHAVIAAARPINRLMQMPMERSVDVGRTCGGAAGREYEAVQPESDANEDAVKGFQS